MCPSTSSSSRPRSRGQLTREDDRALAERDERDVAVARPRLRDDVDRVGVVEDLRARRHLGQLGRHLLQHVDRAQRHEEPARPLRLLADHALRERDPLVVHARLEAAGPEARQHGVDVGQPGAPVGRGGDRDVEPAGARHPLGEPADQVEPLGVEVDQHDLRAVEVLARVEERGHRAGGAGGAAAEVGDLDACHLFLDRPRQHAADEVPLEEDVDDDDRERDEHGGRRDRGRVAGPRGAGEERQARAARCAGRDPGSARARAGTRSTCRRTRARRGS